MSGGSIEGNTVSGNEEGYGGGVSVQGGTFSMSGGTIDDNTATNGVCNDAYVLNNGNITLSGSAAVGDLVVYSGNSVTVASSFEGSVDTVGIYNGSAYTTGTYNLEIKEHTWSYTASGATITATCSNSVHTATATISAPENLTYDGNAKAATVSGSDWTTYFTALPNEITYTNKTDETDDSTSTSASTNAGTCTASITVGGKTASVEFTIEKASQTAPTGLVATQETAKGKGDGTITGLSNTDIDALEISSDSGKTYTALSEAGTLDKDKGMLSGLAAGSYLVRYAGKDNYNPSDDVTLTVGAGNQLKVTAPETQTGYTLTADPASVDYNGSTTLTLTLEAGWTTEDVENPVSATNGTLGTGSETTTQDGKTAITYRLTNITEDSTITVTVKDIAPTFAAPVYKQGETTLTTDAWNYVVANGEISVTISITEQGSSLKVDHVKLKDGETTTTLGADSENGYTLSGNQENGYTLSFSIPAGFTGNYEIKAEDSGNYVTYYSDVSNPKIAGIIVDTMAPTVTAEVSGTPVQGVSAVYQSNAKVTISASDGGTAVSGLKSLSYVLTKDGKDYKTGDLTKDDWSTSRTESLSQSQSAEVMVSERGSYVMTVTCTDNAGNKQTQTVSFTVYATPTLTLTPVSSIVYDGSAIVAGTDFTLNTGGSAGTVTYSYCKADSTDSFTEGLPAAAGSTYTADGNGTIAIESAWFGKTLSIVRKAPNANYSDSDATKLAIPARPAAPSLSLDYKTESVTISDDYCYNTSSADYGNTAWAAGSSTAVTVAPETSVYIYAAATAFGWNGEKDVTVRFRTAATDSLYASEAASVSISARPAVPDVNGTDESIDGYNDGSITGLKDNTGYQISKDDSKSWSDAVVSNGSITGLQDGTYYLRLKATAGSFAGYAKEIEIAAGDARVCKLTVTAPKDNKHYKYYVKAYCYVNGKKVYLAKSPAMHVAMGKAKATVTASGRITAKACGTCKIYVVAPNGRWKAVTVTVK